MNTNSVTFIEIAKRFIRLRQVRRSALALTVLSAVLVAMLACFASLRLSAAQKAQSELGFYQHRIQAPAPIGDLFTDKQVSQLHNSLEALVGTGKFEIAIRTDRLVPDNFIQQVTTGDIPLVRYSERFKPNTKTDDIWNVELLSGRLPNKPGEAALSVELYNQLGKPSKINIYGDMLPLQVTGVVKPIFHNSSLDIYAGWGSWQHLPGQLISARNSTITSSSLYIYWSGDISASEIANAVCAALGKECNSDEVAQSESFLTDYVTSQGFSLEKNAFAIVGITVLMTVLASFVVVNILRNRMSSILNKLSSVGVRHKPVFAAMVVTLSGLLNVGIIVGAGIGVGTAVAVKRFILAKMIDHPMSSLTDAGLWRIVLIQLIIVVIAVPIYAYRRVWVASKPRKRTRGLNYRRFNTALILALRWIFGAILVFSAFQMAPQALEQGDEGTYRFVIFFTTGFALITPEIVSVILAILPTSRSVILATVNIIKADLSRFAFAMAIMMIAIGVPTAVSSRALSIDISIQKSVKAAVPEGQLWVDFSEMPSEHVAEDAYKLINSHMSNALKPAKLYQGSVQTARGTAAGEKNTALSHFDVAIVKDEESAELIFKGFWHNELANAFKNGALITYPSGPDTLLVSNQNDSESKKLIKFESIYRLPTETYNPLFGSATISLAKAKELGINDLRLKTLAFYNLTDNQTSNLYYLLASNGFSTKIIKSHTPVKPFTLDARYWILLVANALIVLAIVWLVLRGQAKHLEEYSTRLNAVGLNWAWSARLLMTMTIFISLVGTVLGVTLGLATSQTIINVLTSLGNIFTLQVPLGYLAILITSVLISSTVGGLLSLSRLNPQKRLTH